jgi:hypothetical protein
MIPKYRILEKPRLKLLNDRENLFMKKILKCFNFLEVAIFLYFL